jgi:NAD(P)-dependent dehydrogenase (short-subunit alcohol dehydrogenase family)
LQKPGVTFKFKDDVKSMDGKICLITGASQGIGYYTALGLARLNATVVIASKNEQRGIEAKKNIIRESNNGNVEWLPVDLSSFYSIRKFTDNFKSKYGSLDVLINNAGVYYSELTFSEDRIEMQFAVNHLAPFLVTYLLMERWQPAQGSRIINVSSRYHFLGRMHFEDLHLKNKYNGLTAYCQSKLAMVLFTYKLAEKIKDSGTTVNCLDPGAARTNIAFSHSTGLYPLLVHMVRPVLISPEKASGTSILLASSPGLKGVNGKYFERSKVVRSSKASFNETDSDLLWEISEKLTGIKFL